MRYFDVDRHEDRLFVLLRFLSFFVFLFLQLLLGKDVLFNSAGLAGEVNKKVVSSKTVDTVSEEDE